MRRPSDDLTRRALLCLLPASTLISAFQSPVADDSSLDQPNILPAPGDSARWEAWRNWLHDWRTQARSRINYSDALYRREDFAWVRSCLSCCFVMMCDESFYDRKAGRYSVAAFLDDGQRRFGGYDVLVLWQAYPRIGLDDRNQFDFYRDMPGGLPGLRRIADECHARGVRIFVDYNPWDERTRREPVGDIEALAVLVKAIQADGIFLDTMKRGAAEFRARLDAARPGVVLEGEGALPLENIRDHHMSWAQLFKDSEAPGVLRNKWFERRHVLHQIDRFSHDHSSELQTAWMNGTGMMVWENVFGTWVGWSARDQSIYRSILPVQRRFVDLFAGDGWTPLVSGVVPPGVYASLWDDSARRLWTIVNRSEAEVSGPILEVQLRGGERCFDLIAGTEIHREDRQTHLHAHLGPRGVGAFLAAPPEALGRDFDEFLAGQRRLNSSVDFSTSFPAQEAALRPPARTTPLSAVPQGMVAIPGAELHMRTQFRIREVGFYESTSPHFVGGGFHKLHVPIWFERNVTIERFAIDIAPVTNADFAKFLADSGYRPRHERNFLRHWKNGAPPAAKERHPVVWVDLDDARAYANWAGKRLPAEEEWQYAAQGTDGREWPWGASFDRSRSNGGGGSTTPVTAYPEGRSPFGLYDMSGNVWEWTESERTDGRTRFAIVRGGSFYDPKGSDWYMDGGAQPANFAEKFLLMWAGLDRCATVGFRCAADIA